MKIVYSDQSLLSVEPYSIFLAGPTPRDDQTKSWRPEALEYLKEIQFTGTVLVPERQSWQKGFDYNTQVEWEFSALSQAGAIVFWVPSTPDTMQALTTRCEFGMFMALDASKIVYGHPADAWKLQYLDWWYQRLRNKAPHTTLVYTLQFAVSECRHRCLTRGSILNQFSGVS